MNPKPIVIHTHFHKKRTGVTRSIENVFSSFDPSFDVYIFGYGIEGKKISIGHFLRLVFSGSCFVLHCHRNIEVFMALIFRLWGGRFILISTRHAETPPSLPTRFLLKKSDAIVVLTENMKRIIPYPSVVIEHGVNQHLFKPGRGKGHSEIRQKNILTCVGRVRRSKGQKVLIDAVAPFLKEYPDWAVAIVGKADKPGFLNELKRVIARHSLENQVYFIEETTDIISYYQASHSVIVPSFSEGFSLVCAEAMSCGCNVLASRNAGIHSKIIQDRENGYLFDVYDTHALTHLLKALFSGQLVHLGKNAQKAIAEKWSSGIEAEKLHHLYRDLIR
jgi:mannosyltransferase